MRFPAVALLAALASKRAVDAFVSPSAGIQLGRPTSTKLFYEDPKDKMLRNFEDRRDGLAQRMEEARNQQQAAGGGSSSSSPTEDTSWATGGQASSTTNVGGSSSAGAPEGGGASSSSSQRGGSGAGKDDRNYFQREWQGLGGGYRDDGGGGGGYQGEPWQQQGGTYRPGMGGVNAAAPRNGEQWQGSAPRDSSSTPGNYFQTQWGQGGPQYEYADQARSQRVAEESYMAGEGRYTEGARSRAGDARYAEREARLTEQARYAEEARIAEEARLVEEARFAEEENWRRMQEQRERQEFEFRRQAEEREHLEMMGGSPFMMTSAGGGVGGRPGDGPMMGGPMGGPGGPRPMMAGPTAMMATPMGTPQAAPFAANNRMPKSQSSPCRPQALGRTKYNMSGDQGVQSRMTSRGRSLRAMDCEFSRDDKPDGMGYSLRWKLVNS